jgi:hypothetical protein
MGHPWPGAANPASCRVAHASESAFGLRGLTGRSRSKQKQKQKQKLTADLLFVGAHEHREAAMAVYRTDRYREQAHSYRFGVSFKI